LLFKNKSNYSINSQMSSKEQTYVPSKFVMSPMIKEYFDIYKEKVKEYGDKTCVLYENGAFYEIYQLDNEFEKVGNASILAKVLNDMKYTSKVIGKITVNFVGFNTSCLDKFLPLLLSANYTVIIVNQLEDANNRNGKGNLKRGVTKIYSPGLQPLDYQSGNLLHIMIKIDNVKTSNKKNSRIIHQINTSVCCVKNEYNELEISENMYECNINDNNSLNLCLEELERIIYRYFAKELHVQIKLPEEMESFWGLHTIENFFNNNYENVLIKYVSDDNFNKFTKTDIQNEMFRDVYSHINFGLIQPIEYMNLEKYELSIVNLMYTIEFIGRHDATYLQYLRLPKIIHENSNLVLELNTVSQLNIISKSVGYKSKPESVFDVINYTKTSLGKRHLMSLLCKPFKDHNTISWRYHITEELSKIHNNLDSLNNIYDFEKLHRKMGLELLHPFEFTKLDYTYQNIINLHTLVKENCNLSDLLLNDNDILKFQKYIEDYSHKFNLEKMKNIDLNTNKDEIVNYFNNGIITELDEIERKIVQLEDEREQLRLFYDEQINTNKANEMIKLMYTENEGYSFVCTKIRYQLLLERLKGNNIDNHFKIKQTNNTTKFYPEKLIKLSNELLNFRELLHRKIKIHYLNTLKDYYSKYNSVFDNLKLFIETVDVCQSNYKCSKLFKYTKPEIINTHESFLKAKELRHPIIERLGKLYIPNDIILDKTSNGMLLYGLNSAGKSSLLRAIGINIILAQCGLYVPCKEFQFSPFDTIISQVDLTDNLFSGKSSFITEMMGLKKILKCSSDRTLVLCDEMCKGTETNSSISLVTATLLKLLNDSCKFFFTSHLHDIPKLECIKSNSKVKVCHLSVSIRNGQDIIFERRLQLGSGSELYGLEVAKTLLDNSKLIDEAFNIRNSLLDSSKKDKKSVYNKKKTVKKCEICESTKNLETDHIIPQCEADSEGYLNDKHYHKNEQYNLAILCKKCHLKKTQGKIIIHGYKESLNGRFLDYEEVN
jgi:DNA mismatch repair protein MutS